MELIDITKKYNNDPELGSFTHLHFYPADEPTSEDDPVGTVNQKYFTVIGVNTAAENGGAYMKFGQRFDRADNQFMKRITIDEMGFWHDGSFYIKGFFFVDKVQEILKVATGEKKKHAHRAKNTVQKRGGGNPLVIDTPRKEARNT